MANDDLYVPPLNPNPNPDPNPNPRYEPCNAPNDSDNAGGSGDPVGTKDDGKIFEEKQKNGEQDMGQEGDTDGESGDDDAYCFRDLTNVPQFRMPIHTPFLTGLN